MLKIENTEVLGWVHAIRGMRNPMNSWEKSDSEFDREPRNYFDEDDMPCTDLRRFVLGSNDLALMTRLRNAGTDHRKFMRMILVEGVRYLQSWYGGQFLLHHAQDRREGVHAGGFLMRAFDGHSGV